MLWGVITLMELRVGLEHLVQRDGLSLVLPVATNPLVGAWEGPSAPWNWETPPQLGRGVSVPTTSRHNMWGWVEPTHREGPTKRWGTPIPSMVHQEMGTPNPP